MARKEITSRRFFVMEDGSVLAESERKPEEVRDCLKRNGERFLNSLGYVKDVKIKKQNTA